MNINPSEHTLFLSGYMDAVSRVLTNNSDLCILNARVIESVETIETTLDCSVTEVSEVENITTEFEKGLKTVFSANPRERFLFYLTDYVMWYPEYTSSCTAMSIELASKNIPTNHLAWILTLNESVNVLIYLSKQKKLSDE